MLNNNHGNREFTTLLKLFIKDPNSPETGNQKELFDPARCMAPDPNYGEIHFW
jgi:hypothetical protein